MKKITGYLKEAILYQYIEVNKLHNYIWTLSNKDYPRFKIFLIISFMLNIAIYFISAFYTVISVLLIITRTIKPDFLIIVGALISLYITGLTLAITRKGFSKSDQLMKFNLNLIKENEIPKEIKYAIFNFNEELRRDNKRKSKILSIFYLYIDDFVSVINLNERKSLIKNFFNKCGTILDDYDIVDLLKEIIILDNQIKNEEEYKCMQDYLIGTTNIQREDNLFSYLNKLDEHFYKKRLINKIFLSLDAGLEKIGKHLNVLLFFLIILLLIFFPEIGRRLSELMPKF